MTEHRPALTAALSGAELLRWYWLEEELAQLARALGVRTTGGKQQLTARLVAALDGLPEPGGFPARRGSGSAQLTGPLTMDTVLPPGQRSSQLLREFFVGHIGARFRFDAAMREFIAAGQGRTLADAIVFWHSSRPDAPREIGAQFELNRFLRAWHAAHPGEPRSAALAAWRQHRSLPVDARERDGPDNATNLRGRWPGGS